MPTTSQVRQERTDLSYQEEIKREKKKGLNSINLSEKPSPNLFIFFFFSFVNEKIYNV